MCIQVVYLEGLQAFNRARIVKLFLLKKNHYTGKLEIVSCDKSPVRELKINGINRVLYTGCCEMGEKNGNSGNR